MFVAVDGVLYTPPLSAGCLAGVTRELVCDVVDVVQADVPFDVLVADDHPHGRSPHAVATIG